MAVNN